MSATTIDEPTWGRDDGSPVRLFTLTNAQGTRLAVTEWGASIVSLRVNDRHGVADVVLGYDDLDDLAYLGGWAFQIPAARPRRHSAPLMLVGRDGPWRGGVVSRRPRPEASPGRR